MRCCWFVFGVCGFAVVRLKGRVSRSSILGPINIPSSEVLASSQRKATTETTTGVREGPRFDEGGEAGESGSGLLNWAFYGHGNIADALF